MQRFEQGLEKQNTIVLDLKSKAHISKEHFESLNWLLVNSRVDYLTLCHVFKMKNSLFSQYTRQHFISQNGVHTYNTKRTIKCQFIIPNHMV